MHRSTDEFRKNLMQWKGQKKLLEKSLHDLGELRTKIQQDIDDYTEARRIILAVAKETQAEVAAYIESMVTLAVQSVFKERDYRFVVQFVQRKNRTEVELLVRDGEGKEPYYPQDEQGGGLIDIISFALRVVLWSLQPKRSRNVLILDEPFKFTGKYIEMAGAMLKEVSKKLGMQIIMVTHSSELAGVADRAWLVQREGDRSIVRRMDEEGPPLRTRLRRRQSERGSVETD